MRRLPVPSWPVLALTACVTVVLAWVTLTTSGSAYPVPAAGHLAAIPSHRYRDPLIGWTVEYPTGFSIEHSIGAAGPTVLEESTVADFTLRRAIRVHTVHHRTYIVIKVSIEPPLRTGRTFPRDGVALRVLMAGGGPYVPPTPPTRLPLSLRSFTRPSPRVPEPRGVPQPLTRQVSLGQRGDVLVEVWTGHRASGLRRRELARMVASLRFPTPQAGR